MRKGKARALFHLLLMWLLLTAFLLTTKVHAIRADDSKLRPAGAGSRLTAGRTFTTWVQKKKLHKSPSGPNPVGNHRPPTRP